MQFMQRLHEEIQPDEGMEQQNTFLRRDRASLLCSCDMGKDPALFPRGWAGASFPSLMSLLPHI